MLKMYHNTFGGRALPGPAGGAYTLPKPLSRSGDLLLRGGIEGKSLLIRGGRERGNYF